MNTFARRRIAVAACATFVSVPASRIRAQASDSALRAYVHTEVTRLMSRLDIPGAVVVVAHHDAIVMNEAFGLADVEHKIPVDANTTVFRVASVAKVFTAMAALQMVHAGHVSLSQDVRPLLPDILPGHDISEPVTLHQLLTHTAGFDEQLIGYVEPPGVSAASLAQYLATSMPARTRPPGDIPGYSNHGYALVGLLVERLTGTPFNEYARDEIFRPLGMTHTEFILQPTDSTPNLAHEYRSDGTRRTPRSTRAYPAGNVGTTGADMSVFLRWMLTELGRADTSQGSRIAHELAGPILTYSPSLPPMGYGLNGVAIAGRTVWMKGGAAPSHSAVIAVIPDLDVAVFIAVNRQEPLLWDRLMPSLVAKFWSDSSRIAVRDSGSAVPSSALAGTYRWTRAPLGSVERILGLAAQVHVTGAGNDVVVAGPELDGTWSRVGADAFRSADGRTLSFRMASPSRASYLFSIVQGQPVSFERISWYETARFQLATFAGASLLGIVAAGAAARDKGTGGILQPAWARTSIVALPVAELATIAAGVMLGRQGDLLTQGATGTLHTTLALTTATGAIAIAQAAGAVTLASRGSTSSPRRVVYSVGAAGGVALAWFLQANHLVRLPF